MIKLVVTADSHLSAYFAKMTPQQLEERRRALREGFCQAVDFALEHADIFLQAGDLFDMPDPRHAELLFIIQQLGRLKERGIPVYMIGGTHDTPKASDRITPQRILEAIGYAHLFLKKSEIQTHRLSLAGQEIVIGGLSTNHGLPYGEDPLRGLSFPGQGDWNILLLHYGVQGHYPPQARDLVVDLATLDEMGEVNLFCIGHNHAPEDFTLSNKKVIIPGATEKLDFGERDNRTGFYYVELERGSLRTRHVQTASQPMQQVLVRSPEIERLSLEPTTFLLKKLKEVSQEGQLLKMKVVGPISRELYHRIRWSSIWQTGRASNFYFELDLRELRVEMLEIEGGSAGYSEEEEIVRVGEERREKAREEEKALWQEALVLLLAEYKSGRK